MFDFILRNLKENQNRQLSNVKEIKKIKAANAEEDKE